MFAVKIKWMDIIENKLLIERTGVFYQSGGHGKGEVSWFACHGYGQLANNLIKKFDGFVAQGHSVVSVEALNRFYWQGVTGQVVSTWMTKRFRLDEIRDNNAFLSKIYNDKKGSGKNILFGFSQGGTTIWRWIYEKRPDFDVFINYAGWMPEDIDLFQLKDYLSDKTLIFTYGADDEYLTEGTIKAFKEVVKVSGLNIIIHKMNGKHKVDRPVLNDLYTMYVNPND
jgi:predicted esterase